LSWRRRDEAISSSAAASSHDDDGTPSAVADADDGENEYRCGAWVTAWSRKSSDSSADEDGPVNILSYSASEISVAARRASSTSLLNSSYLRGLAMQRAGVMKRQETVSQ
jgi:hypothetical protein